MVGLYFVYVSNVIVLLKNEEAHCRVLPICLMTYKIDSWFMEQIQSEGISCTYL